MRINNLGIQLTMDLPFDRPDKNGVVYSRAAIEKVLKSFDGTYMILYCGNEPSERTHIIGYTDKEPHSVLWNDETKTCTVAIDGIIRYGGTECIINEVKDDVITDFELVSIGLSE